MLHPEHLRIAEGDFSAADPLRIRMAVKRGPDMQAESIRYG